jgi:parvulin-like peptidyl-prolyl isomerase
MIRWLASVSPLAVFLAGVIPAGAVAWFAHGVKFELIDRPAIVREATAAADAACAIRTMDAANRAQQAERDRQTRASAEALRIYREALDASERAAFAAQTQLEKEIAANEATLEAEGRSCLLTGADIVRLYGNGAAGSD